MPLGKVFLGPRADRLRKRTAIGAQLRETRIDFLQMFFAKLGYFAARFATVILQIQDLFCFLERQAQRLRLLNKSDATDRFGRVEAIICRGTLWLRQQSESFVIMQRLRTDSRRLGNCAHLERILIMHDHDVLICDYSAGPWSSALSFCGQRKTLLALSVWTVVRNFRVPIAGHVDLEFGAIAARRTRPLDCASGMHLHSGHVHIHVELDVADIDKLTVAITKFDQYLVVALAKRSFGRNKICREVVDVLGEEWRTGD